MGPPAADYKLRDTSITWLCNVVRKILLSKNWTSGQFGSVVDKDLTKHCRLEHNLRHTNKISGCAIFEKTLFSSQACSFVGRGPLAASCKLLCPPITWLCHLDRENISFRKIQIPIFWICRRLCSNLVRLD